jgi:hypothetical protein
MSFDTYSTYQAALLDHQIRTKRAERNVRLSQERHSTRALHDWLRRLGLLLHGPGRTTPPAAKNRSRATRHRHAGPAAWIREPQSSTVRRLRRARGFERIPHYRMVGRWHATMRK